MPVTSKERRLAGTIDAEIRRIESLGKRASVGLGALLFKRIITAFRQGRPVEPALDKTFNRVELYIRDAMVAAHIAGMRRTSLLLSTSVFRETIRLLKRRQQMSNAEIKELEMTYGPVATTVSTRAKLQVNRELQKTVSDLTARGVHVKEGVRELQQTFAKRGLTPRSSHLLEAVFRTQSQISYSAGRWQADQDPDIEEILWGYKYVTVGDDRVRPEHAALDGTTLPKDDPFWDTYFPPNGWNCRCVAISIYEEQRIVRPKQIEGRIPEPDSGFAFNPGKLYNTL